MKVVPFLLLAASVAMSVGCAKPAADVIGKWQGVRIENIKSDPNNSSPEGQKMAQEMADNIAKVMTAEFKSDGTATFAIAGIPQTGKYEMNGSSLTFTPETGGIGADLSSNKPLTFALSGDGKELKSNQPDGSSVVFERVAK